MTLRAPVQDIAFTMRHGGGARPPDRRRVSRPSSRPSVAETILAGGGPLRQRAVAPLNARRRPRRRRAVRTARVTTPPGWQEAYRAGRRPAGTASPRPRNTAARGCRSLLHSACVEMWNAACLAFGSARC